MLVGFEHIGMTSGNLDRTIDFYVGLLGLDLVLRKRQTRGEVAFLDAGGGMLEVIAPDVEVDLAQDVPDGVAGIRHLTLAFDNIDEVVERLEIAGIEIIERPRLAYNSEILKRVAFCRDPDGIIVELAERAQL